MYVPSYNNEFRLTTAVVFEPVYVYVDYHYASFLWYLSKR